MKKLLLVSAVLVGVATASQAGVNFNLGFGLPLPRLPGLEVRGPAKVVLPLPEVCAPRVVVQSDACYPRYEHHGWYGRGREDRGRWEHESHPHDRR